MVDVRAARQHRRYQRQHFTTRPCPTRPVPQTQSLVHQCLQTETVYQSRSYQQTTVGHQRLVVENHPNPVNVLRYSTHRKCLLVVGRSR